MKTSKLNLGTALTKWALNLSSKRSNQRPNLKTMK